MVHSRKHFCKTDDKVGILETNCHPEEKLDTSHTILKKRYSSFAITPSVSFSSNRSVTWGEDTIYDLNDKSETRRDHYDDNYEMEERDVSNSVQKIYVEEIRTDLSRKLSIDQSTISSTLSSEAASSLSSCSESESFVRRMGQAVCVEEKDISPSSSLHANHSSVRKHPQRRNHRDITLPDQVGENTTPVDIRRNQSFQKRMEHKMVQSHRLNHFHFLYNLSKEMQKDGKSRREEIFYASIRRNAVARKEDFGKIPLEKAADMYIRGIRSKHEKELKLERERKLIAEDELNKHSFKLARGAFACNPDPSRLQSDGLYCSHSKPNNPTRVQPSLLRDRVEFPINCYRFGGDKAIHCIKGGDSSVLYYKFHKEQKIPLSRAGDMYDRSIKRIRAKQERIGAEHEERTRGGSKRIPLSRASDLYLKSIGFIEEKEKKIAEKAASIREGEESKWRPLPSKDASRIYDRYSKEKRSDGLIGKHSLTKDLRKKSIGMKLRKCNEKMPCDHRRKQLEEWRRPKLATNAKDRKQFPDFHNYCFFEKHNQKIMNG